MAHPPPRHDFEGFANGTSNPWGRDFTGNGEAFGEACGIPHMWHLIQGARYQRQGGVHFNPNTYADIPTIAKHRHYLGATPHGGNGRSDEAGGGHAHSGLMIYLGDNWPAEYRNNVFTINLHGKRINRDKLVRKGAGYTATHGEDFLKSSHPYFRPVHLTYGPDGAGVRMRANSASRTPLSDGALWRIPSAPRANSTMSAATSRNFGLSRRSSQVMP